MENKQAARALRLLAAHNQDAVAMWRGEAGKATVYVRSADGRATVRIVTDLHYAGGDYHARAVDLATYLDTQQHAAQVQADPYLSAFTPPAALPEIGWLAGSLAMVLHSAGRDLAQPHLAQVEITSALDEDLRTPVVYAAACDGKRLALVMTDVDAWPEIARDNAIRINTPIARLIVSLRAPCALDIVDGVTWIQCGDVIACIPRDDSAAPEWRALVDGPDGFASLPGVAFFDRKELTRTVDAMRAHLRDEVARDDKEKPRDLRTAIGFRGGRAIVSLLSVEDDKGSEHATLLHRSADLAVDRHAFDTHSGEQKPDPTVKPCARGIDLAYVADALRTMRADHVGVTFGRPDQPITFSDGDQLLAIMPLRMPMNAQDLASPSKPVKAKKVQAIASVAT